MLSFILLILSSLPSASQAQQTDLNDYFDPSLPSFQFAIKPSEIRYSDVAFNTTSLTQLEDAQKIMNELKFNRRSRSQCYQRAHLWSVEILQMAKLSTQKIFLFFSDRYIREHQFPWWFHVAPFVLINDEEYVIDPYFFDRPVDVQTWTNHFMPTHPVCKTIHQYQEYEAETNQQDCFLRKLPMFYFSPKKIEARDKKGSLTTDWVESEVYSAFKSIAPWWRRW